ncbi:hypothetical protein TuanDB_12130, partial [Bacillus anthracis]
NQCSK